MRGRGEIFYFRVKFHLNLSKDSGVMYTSNSEKGI